MTAERINPLPLADKARWAAYLELSQSRVIARRLAAELPAGKLREEGPPHGEGNVLLQKDAARMARLRFAASPQIMSAHDAVTFNGEAVSDGAGLPDATCAGKAVSRWRAADRPANLRRPREYHPR